MDNKRYFSRINFKAQAQVEAKNENYEGDLLDLSLKGALLSFKDNISLKKNDSCKLKIHLPSTDITLTFNAELVHIYENNFGFKFLSVDIDTMTHLRRLIDLNVGDHDKVTNELSFWLKD